MTPGIIAFAIYSSGSRGSKLIRSGNDCTSPQVRESKVRTGVMKGELENEHDYVLLAEEAFTSQPIPEMQIKQVLEIGVAPPSPYSKCSTFNLAQSE